MRILSIPSPFFREDVPLARGLPSDQYVEKAFLYLLLISIALHVAGFVTLYFWPKEQQQQQISEPNFIDLQDMTELKPPPQQQQPEKVRPSDRRQRVVKETAPRPATQVAPSSKTPSTPKTAKSRASAPPGRPGQAGPPAKPFEAGSAANELLRRKPQHAGTGGGGGGTKPQPNLVPSASRLARLEEDYRRRFADDIDEGTTRFLNSDDIQFGSFLRRFETAVYGVWRYPQEAALQGVEGVTPVKITFNKNGEIVKVQLLDSSGSRILDDEVFRTLRLIGPMGNFPKTYGKEEFNLIAFFQYGNARSRLR